MKLVLHVGLHRAASTTLQRWLKSRREAWAAAPVLVQAGLSSPQAGSPFAVLAGNLFLELGAERAAQYLAAELDALSAQFEAAVVSDENLLGPMPGGAAPPFAAAGPLAAALRLLGERHQVMPLVILREHGSWLRSLFHTQQLRGETRSFAAFADALPPERLCFAPLLEELSGLRAGAPIITSLEAIAADGGAGLRRGLTAFLGLPEGEEAPWPKLNAERPPLLRRITALLGSREAMLADLGGRGFAALLGTAPPPPGELAALIERHAVRVDWRQAPGSRMAAANAVAREGTPPGLRLDSAACREIADAALATLPGEMACEDMNEPLRSRLAADRAVIASRYLPEWRGLPP